MGGGGGGGLGGLGGGVWRGRGGDPTCDCYGGNEVPSVVAKVRMCGIVLPLTPMTVSDKFSNVPVLLAIVPRVAAPIMKRCMSSHAKISNFASHFASIIDIFVSYSP